MATVSPGIYSLNAGEVSPKALARVDLQRLRLAAQVQENLLPTVLGPCVMRPGTEYLGRAKSDDVPVFLPFIYDEDVSAMVVITQNGVQFMVDGSFVNRPSISTSFANGTFDTNLAGWTNADESGATSDWATGGYMRLVGTGSNSAIRKIDKTIAEDGVEHGLRVVVERGPINLKVGYTDGGSEYVSEKSLGTGEHSISFTPSTANDAKFYVTVRSSSVERRLIDSIQIESGNGRLNLDNPWGSDAGIIRYDQSGAILFVACNGYEQRRIRLYDTDMRSWGIDLYQTSDGPFDFPNTTGITLTPDDVSGNITIDASAPFFSSGYEGSLFRLTHSGQTATATLSGDNQYSGYIRVTGLAPNADGGTQRDYSIEITGTFTGTITLQRSVAEPGAWTDEDTWTAPVTATRNDELSNQIIYYRLGINTGDYGSGSATVTLTYSNSIQKGIVRVNTYVSTTQVTAEVIETLGKAEATADWERGEWSGVTGFPSAVRFHDGRLWWAKDDFVYGSVSDAFNSFDDEFEGDAGPIIRSIATGPVDGIRWMLSMQRLIAGSASQEVSMRASSFDEPLSPTQFTARDFSTRGTANIQAVKVDGRGIFVQRNRKRVYLVSFAVDSGDYSSQDLTRLNPEICEAGIVGMAVQRMPDTRIWFWLDNGDAAVLTYEPDDEVVAWTPFTTSGNIKAIAVLPGTNDDEVYFAVRRVPTSGPIMAIEKLANQSEAVAGETLCKVMDSHVVQEGVATSTVTGLDHLEGLSVVAYGDNEPIPGTFTVSGGEITLPDDYADVVVGLPYTGKFQSAKLAHGAVAGTAIGKQKRIARASLLMNDVAWYGVTVGRNFTDMHRLPATLGNGRALRSTETIAEYDYNMPAFNGGWGPDERVCFKVTSPYSATFQGVVMQIETSEPHTFGAGVRPGGDSG